MKTLLKSPFGLSVAGWMFLFLLMITNRSQGAEAWQNSLGMMFLPVTGTQVKFSIWPTRVKDYQAFDAESDAVDHAWAPNHGPDHPVRYIAWDDAKLFCAWLTVKERKEGKISATQEYRLPTDAEWSWAVGIGGKEDESKSLADRSFELKDVFPWGEGFPPPVGVGNYSSDLGLDDYEETSPVGSFKPNAAGLFDMSGNVFQWVEDHFDPKNHPTWRTLRGCRFTDGTKFYLKSSYRARGEHNEGNEWIGFRIVLAEVGK